MISNRLIKNLSKYIAGKDGNRLALTGVACHGPHMVAVDGHKLVYVETHEENQHFEDSAVYEIDEKQALNADFVAQAHSFLNGNYPNIPFVVPEDDPDVELTIQVKVLLDLLRFLDSINVPSVVFKIVNADTKYPRIIFETIDEAHYKGGAIKRAAGMVMPMLMPYHWPDGRRNEYPRKKNHLALMKPLFNEIVEAVNNFEPSNLQEA